MFVKRRVIQIPEGHKECPTCGRIIPKKEKHAAVERIVRANNHYGDAGPGAIVLIEETELSNPVIGQVTMSLEEHAMLTKAREKAVPEKKNKLAEMVEKNLRYAEAEVKRSIERGKRSLDRAIEKATEAREDALKSQPSAVDKEQSSQERREVEG